MLKHKGGIFWILILCILFVLFFLIGIYDLDPDFGWHYQMGKYLQLHKSVPLNDPFSYTMPSFSFISHEWLTDLIISTSYDHMGIVGLAAIFAAIPIIAIILSSPLKTLPWLILPTIFSAELLLPRGGIRPQEITWLMIAILLFLLRNKGIWNTWRWGLPLLFCLWANLHGGFALGITLLFITIALNALENKRLEIGDFLVWLLSLLAISINPYGWRIWLEVWRSISDSNLRFTIYEWQPFFALVEIPLFFLAILGGVLWWSFRKNIAWWEIGIFILFFLAALSSIRHAALFAIVALPFVSNLILMFISSIKKTQLTKRRIFIFFIILYVIAAVSGVITYFQSFRGGFIPPTNAVIFLKNHPFHGNLLANYNWGGYLIWKYPEKKVFVDGRMPSWRWNLWPENEDAPKNESSWAYKEYLNILQKKQYNEAFKKYNITRIMLRRDQVPVKKGWRKIYQDQEVVILEKE
ncbi:MAG TPA: hypothetical protein PKA38_00675 [Candidatus Levybacteria bacterium]|nr:hypothetical protein [Candidatus Levybacteria bacterium]